MMSNFRCAGALLAVVALPALSAEPTVSSWPDPIAAPAEPMPLTAQSLLTDVVRAGERYVAVGARGAVLVSADGKNWHQASVPTRMTFTAVTAIDAQVWAVGHEGVIAHSADAGEHWELQRKDPWQPAPESATRDPQQGGPLLGVLFTDIRHGYAVGAYSVALKTEDGGATWTPMTIAKPASDASDETKPADKNAKGGKGDHADTFSKEELTLGQESTPHLNAIARTGSGALFVVGERGSTFHSRDAGATWQRAQLPYDGSMFGVIGYDGDRVLTFGLRGHVYESSDLGAHWTQVATNTELSLMGGSALPDGGAAIAGVNGIVLLRAKGGEPFKNAVDAAAGTIAHVLPFGDAGALLVAGENGIGVFEPK